MLLVNRTPDGLMTYDSSVDLLSRSIVALSWRSRVSISSSSIEPLHINRKGPVISDRTQHFGSQNDAAYATCIRRTSVRLRRRIEKPTPPKPSSIIAQVPGSGTPETAAKVSVPE